MDNLQAPLERIRPDTGLCIGQIPRNNLTTDIGHQPTEREIQAASISIENTQVKECPGRDSLLCCLTWHKQEQFPLPAEMNWHFPMACLSVRVPQAIPQRVTDRRAPAPSTWRGWRRMLVGSAPASHKNSAECGALSSSRTHLADSPDRGSLNLMIRFT